MDILYQLGLTAQSSAENERTSSPLTAYTTAPSPFNLPVPGFGVLLNSDSLYEAPAGSLFPPEFGEDFSVVVSLSSWRANNAFLLSIKDSRDRLRFGIQLLPRRVVVYTAEKASIYFTYNWQDGHQHSFAVGVRARSVSFYADCGAVQQREQTLGRSLTLGDSRGLFTLGRMNSKAAAFHGRVCQLHIYPSAQAAAHYCSYLKKRCRLADTFRLLHSGFDIEANDPSANPLIRSSVGVAPTRRAPVNSITEAKLTHNLTLKSSVKLHQGDESHISTLDHHGHSTGSSLKPDSPIPPKPSGKVVLDPIYSTTMTTAKRTSAKENKSRGGDNLSENSTEDESSSVSLQTPHATADVTSPASQSRLKEGLKNNSITGSMNTRIRPQESPQPQEMYLRANGTTLYRENHVDTSEQHDLDGSYDDVNMEGYDYGYEKPEFFYDYEGGFHGPKGEPGPVVSDWIYE